MDTIRKIYEEIDFLINDNSYDEINAYINTFLKTKNELTLYVALLIATYRRRRLIDNRILLYDETRLLARQKCLDKGVPNEQIEADIDLLVLDLY
jgi:hypothetical protein